MPRGIFRDVTKIAYSTTYASSASFRNGLRRTKFAREMSVEDPGFEMKGGEAVLHAGPDPRRRKSTSLRILVYVWKPFSFFFLTALSALT